MKKIHETNSLVSIITVNYNGKRWLKKYLDSVLCQTHENIELILVDNASTDDSIEFIKNNFNDKRIKIVTSRKNLGFAGGNNLGLQYAAGGYVMLLNNDTWFDHQMVEKVYNFYEESYFDVVAPYIRDYYNEKKFEAYCWKIDLLGHPIRVKKTKDDDNFYLGGACLFFKKKLYEETLGLDADFFMYSEEVDWFWRLNLLDYKICYIDDVFVFHAGGGSTGEGIKYLSFLWRNQNILQMLLKNYKFINLLWVLPVYFIQNIFEIIFFLLIFKPKIAYSYVQGWWFNIINFKKVIQKRKWVQENRLVGDYQIMKKMYFGFAKVYHLISFYKGMRIYKNNKIA